MANLFGAVETFFAAALQGNAATSITYRRGGATLSISATKGASGHQVDQTTGIFSWFDQDWLIPAAVLTLGVPLRGDEILVGTEIYKVLPPEGEECWRWSDHHQTIYRIHSERVKE